MRGSKREKTILLQPNNLGKTGVFVEGGKGAKVFKKISIGRVVGGGGVFVFAVVRVGLGVTDLPIRSHSHLHSVSVF